MGSPPTPDGLRGRGHPPQKASRGSRQEGRAGGTLTCSRSRPVALSLGTTLTREVVAGYMGYGWGQRGQPQPPPPALDSPHPGSPPPHLVVRQLGHGRPLLLRGRSQQRGDGTGQGPPTGVTHHPAHPPNLGALPRSRGQLPSPPQHPKDIGRSSSAGRPRRSPGRGAAPHWPALRKGQGMDLQAPRTREPPAPASPRPGTTCEDAAG